MNRHHQQGSSSLAFVLLLFSLGMLILNGLQQQLHGQRTAVAGEVRYLKEYAAATSAMAWGGQQSWQGKKHWQCQQQTTGWRACLRITEDGKGIMAAQGVYPKESAPVTLWRWGTLSSGRWAAAPHGWADFCPLPEVDACLLPD
ncbi:YgdB family protein [Dryocola clanedunensis]